MRDKTNLVASLSRRTAVRIPDVAYVGNNHIALGLRNHLTFFVQRRVPVNERAVWTVGP